MTAANLALRFAIELAGLAGLAIWGASAASSTAANVALAIAAPLAAATVWGIWSAPKAPRRLHGRALIALELAVLATACAALAAAGHLIAAVLLAIIALVNGAMLDREPPPAT